MLSMIAARELAKEIVLFCIYSPMKHAFRCSVTLNF
jgi:hypothetical protein